MDSSEKPGIVIATFQSFEDRRRVLSVKNNLKNCSQYGDVFISKDQSLEERTTNRNMNLIVKALREKGSDLSIRGNRIVHGYPYQSDRRGNQSDKSDRDMNVRHGSGSRSIYHSGDDNPKHNSGSGTHNNGAIYKKQSANQSNSINEQNSSNTHRSANSDRYNKRQWSDDNDNGRDNGRAHGNGGHHGNRGQGQRRRSYGGQRGHGRGYRR